MNDFSLIGGIAVVLIGLFTGVMFAAAMAISPSLALLDGENYTKVKQCQIRILQVLMTSLSVAYLFIAGYFAWSQNSSDTTTYTVIAMGLVVLALVYSAFTDIPYNQAILKWTPEKLPADWQKVRSAWDTANNIRTVPVLLAFIFQIAALASLPR